MRKYLFVPFFLFGLSLLSQDDGDGYFYGAAHASSDSQPYKNLHFETINNIPVQLELSDTWNKKSIEQLLSKASTMPDPNKRLAFIALQFQGVPFHFESARPLPQAGHLRVNFREFDCTTFIYTMLALSRSSDFKDFVSNLAAIRYRNYQKEGILSNPETGNIYDYVYNSLVDSAVAQGILKNQTKQIDQAFLRQLSKKFVVQKRNKKSDKNRQVLTPKRNLNQKIKLDFIPNKYVDTKEVRSQIKSGDILLFVRRIAKDGIFGHLSIAIKGSDLPFHFTDDPEELDKLYYIQSSIHDDQDGNMLGVNIAGNFIENSKSRKKVNGRMRTIYRYQKNSPRLVSDFLQENKESYKGVFFLRPQ